MQIEVTKDFKYAYGGNRVVEYTAGERPDVLEECGDLAIKEGWEKAIVQKEEKKPKRNAPENSSIDGAPEIK